MEVRREFKHIFEKQASMLLTLQLSTLPLHVVKSRILPSLIVHGCSLDAKTYAPYLPYKVAPNARSRTGRSL